MTEQQQAAMRMALEAMRDAAYDEEGYTLNPDLAEAHDALRQALEQQPADEPVAYRYGACLFHDMADVNEFIRTSNDGYQIEPLYTRPQPAAPAIPKGMRLVPVEPTKAMAKAYWQFNSRQDVRMIDAWKAMLAAAPEQPAAQWQDTQEKCRIETVPAKGGLLPQPAAPVKHRCELEPAVDLVTQKSWLQCAICGRTKGKR